MKNLLCTLAFIAMCSILIANPKTAIQWQKTIGGFLDDNLISIQPTTDGGYILGGSSSSGVSGNKTPANLGGTDYWLVKLNPYGQIQWQKVFGGTANDDLRVVVQTEDGGYILGGYSQSGISGNKTQASYGSNDIWIIKVDAQGAIQWQNTIGGSGDDVLFALNRTKDGGYIAGGYSSSGISGVKTEASKGGYDFWVIKLNAQGSIQWQKTIGGSSDEMLYSIEQTSDNGYIMGGKTLSGLSGDKTEASQGNWDFWVIKLNESGSTIEWQNTIGGDSEDHLIELHQINDGGYILGGGSYSSVSGDKAQASYNGNSDLWIIKLNQQGTIVWQKTITGDLWDLVYSMKQTRDGGYIVGASTVSDTFRDKTVPSDGGMDFWILKLDTTGNIEWQNNIGGSNEDQLYSINQTIDGGYIFGGQSSSNRSGDKSENSYGGNDFWIIKLAEDPRYITGTIFADFNNNCSLQANSKKLKNVTVRAKNTTGSISFATSDTLGKYAIAIIDTGNYTISIDNNPDYLLYAAASCNQQTIHLVDSVQTLNLALKPILQCSSNEVNVSASSLFRRCIENTFYVTYSNNGTVTSLNTYIDVTLDRYLDFNNSSIPATSLGNNVYRFQIGDVPYLQSGNFFFTATPVCDSTINGQTLCTEAHIYPDTICSTPVYDGSYIVATAGCLGDSVELRLHNQGGSMNQIKKYLVIEGDVVRLRNDYQLPEDGNLSVKMPSDSGKTYRIIAEQESTFPPNYGDPYSTAAIEGCRAHPDSSFSIGYVTIFSNYDGEPFRSLTCNTIIGSYDPNDKAAVPRGYGANHFIEANTDIDYLIRFQNTGNDTAFKVVIVDTISATLDINTIQPGTSSHTYQFQRLDTNVVAFVFNNINLVDSIKNEPKSHGFVKFRIKQKANNPDGTKLYNSADIFFDFNAPIKTNTTFHTIGREFMRVNLLTVIMNNGLNVKDIKVFPNPFREQTQVIIEGDQLRNPVLILMDINGKIIKNIASSSNTFTIQREDIINGMYLFKILQDNKEVATGKLIAQ